MRLSPATLATPTLTTCLVVAALDSGRTDAAILSLERAAAAAPQFSGARMELARAHFEAGEFDDARPLFAALLTEDPPAAVRNVIDQYLAVINAGPGTPPSRFSLMQNWPSVMTTMPTVPRTTSSSRFHAQILKTSPPSPRSSKGARGLTGTVPKSATFAWQVGAHASYRTNPDATFVDSGVVSILGGTLWRSGANFAVSISTVIQRPATANRTKRTPVPT